MGDRQQKPIKAEIQVKGRLGQLCDTDQQHRGRTAISRSRFPSWSARRRKKPERDPTEENRKGGVDGHGRESRPETLEELYLEGPTGKNRDADDHGKRRTGARNDLHALGNSRLAGGRALGSHDRPPSLRRWAK